MRLPRPAGLPHTLAVAAALTVVATSNEAAALEQPNGQAIPSQMGCDSGRPTGLAAALACVCDPPAAGCNIGDPCPGPDSCPPIPGGTCETTLWHSFNDNTCIPSNLSGIDPWTDASLTPETFTPTCGLTFTVVTRGTARFGDVFGWYNATGGVPSPDDLHVMLDCAAPAGTQVVLDVRGDPGYAGGEIGFFLATPESHTTTGDCAGGDCCATIDRIRAGEGHVYYSQRALNPDAAGPDSYIHLLVLDSAITPRKFYFAWEDIFGGSNNDFTDIVTSVEGVECSGGGVACDTGAAGVCGMGISTCATGGGMQCVQLYRAEAELCDGADNDCDGEVDEGDGVCSDDVSAGCGDVSCPVGQVCRGGACLDPCDTVTCAGGEVCRGGVCFPGCTQCNGIVCAADESCHVPTGACIGGDTPGGADAGPVIGGADAGTGFGVDAGDNPETPPDKVGACGCAGHSDPDSRDVAGAIVLALGLAGFLRRRRKKFGT